MNHSDRSRVYQIRVEGIIRKGWFEDQTVITRPGGETIVSGTMDQAALHGVLGRIRDLGLVLLSIQSDSKEKGNPHE